MTRRISKFFSILLVICMILSMIPATVFAATPDVLYLKPNSEWLVDNARFAAYFFGSGDTWVSMTDADGDGYYEAAVPSGYTSVIFCRMTPDSSENNWDNKWNQTADLTIPTDGTNCWTLNSGDWTGGGSWSTYSAAAEVDYYLFGYINGANYACEDDDANLGSYKFTDGSLSATFTCDSYVGVKTSDNANWYMTEGYLGAVKTATLYNTVSGISVPEKLFVPGGVKVTFTLTVNSNGTLTLSYTVDASTCQHLSHSTSGVCTACGSSVSHSYSSGTCTVCGAVCSHSWSSGKCSVCGISCTHSYNSGVVTKAATCTTTGVKTYTCSICGGTKTETIAATGHSYSSVVTAPTCTASGYTTYTCAACGDSYTGNTTSATGHNYVNGTCTNCGDGCSHSWNSGVVTKAATCTTSGVKTYTCSICGGTKTETIAATGHSYSSKVTAPTCTEDGYTTYTCSSCGDSYTGNTTSATGHSYTSKVTKAATCTTAGVRTYTCSKCGGSYTEAIAATGHSYSSKVTAPTCTEAGYTTYTCTVCGDSYTGDTTAATGHSYVAGTCTACGDGLDFYLFGYINGANYACEEDGSNLGSYKFTNGKLTATFDCDSYVGVKTSDNGSWYMTEGYDASAATVTLYNTTSGIAVPEKMFVPGGAEVTFTLTANSNDTLNLSYVITSCSHNYSSEVTKEATCTASGVRTYTCSICGNTYTETIAATGHSYVTGTCTVCGDTLDFYLFGYINGANYACEEDASNLGSYKFSGGKLTATFDCDSYVAVKTGDNASWYMTNGYPGDGVSSATLYNTNTEGIEVNKLYVPGGAEVTFTLTANSNDTLTLSYVITSCSHNYSSEVTKEATCTASGVRTYTCSICGNTYTETIAATGHNYVNGTCTNCGDGCDHSYDSGTVTTAATCTTAGVKTYTCSICGGTKTETIAATGHSYAGGSCTVCGAADPDYTVDYYLFGYINGSNYACEEDGENLGIYKFEGGTLVATFDCDSYVCVKTGDNANWYMTEGYDASAVTVTLYNTASGIAVPEKMFVPGGVEVTFTLTVNSNDTLTLSYVISNCSHSYSSEVTKAATCTESGTRTYTCSICGGSYTETIAATGHSYEAVVTAPTCTEDGYTTYTCSSCGDSYTGNTTSAIGHNYVGGVCSNCGDGCSHSWNSGVITTAATCTTAGVKTYTCSLCGNSKTETIAATGHSYVNGTCTACGASDGSFDGIRIHLVNTLGWDSVCTYVWTDNGTAAALSGWSWPGQAVQRDENGYFTFDVDYDPVSGESLGFLFHNFNGSQTADVVVSYATLSSSKELWVKPSTSTNSDGKYDCTVATAESGLVISPEVNGTEITFRYEGSASSVYLAGSMNDWSSTANALTKGSDGVWTLTMTLEPGVYEYKFIVDGSWITDPCNGVIGGYDSNSIVVVPGSETAADGKITVVLHFYRESGEYDGWDVWFWGSETSGAVEFQEDPQNKGMLASFTVDGSLNSSLGYVVRKSDWSDKEFYDRFIDLSNVNSGTVHFYLNSGSATGSKILCYDVVYGSNATYANLDYDSGNIWVKTSLPATGTLTSQFSIVDASGNATGISVTGVTLDNYGYALKLSRNLTVAEANNYYVKYNGCLVAIKTEGLFYSAAFNSDYNYTGDDLGATWSSSSTTFKVWAPTALNVAVKLYESGNYGTDDLIKTVNMTLGEKGVWSCTVSGNLHGTYYNYDVTFSSYTVEATDPYAKATGANGDRGMVINLNSTDPEGWDEDISPNQGMSYTDAVIYELHVREFTIDDSSGVKSAWKGKYLGLTQSGTSYNGYSTGLEHLKELGVTHIQLMPVYDYNSVDEYHLSDWQQYAWGYDPKNYNVPEGSYSTDPFNGEVRVEEFKEMVQTLHENGFNVVMDVVFNHFFDGGNFCYNKIVPNYFCRFYGEGNWSNGSGCGNDMATERVMARNYIVDSILYWVEEYHIDGFRFDLVGLIDTQTINEIVSAVHAKYPYVMFYGEGWAPGSTAVEDGYSLTTQGNAWQVSDFGFFNDSLRNAVAGDNGNSWGFASGSWDYADAIANYFRASNGWSTSPTQTINYVSCHDNYSLMDKLCISRNGAYWSELVRMNNLSAAIYMMAQGTPFIYSGEELLREKQDESGNRYDNAYGTNDYINKIRWSDLADKEYAQVTDDYYAGLIEFRKNHAALRCTSGSDAWNYVTYYKISDQTILFYISGYPNYECSDGIVIIYNANSSSVTVNLGNYGIPSGYWQACVHGQQAGITPLWGVDVGSGYGEIGVEGISTTILVLGDLVDEDSVYNNQPSNCDHTNHNTSGMCTSCGKTVEHTYSGGSCTVCGLSQSAPTTYTVYYDNSETAWSEVYIYSWTKTAGQTQVYSGSWPGAAMTLVDTANSIYAYELPIGASNIIFSGSGGQTADLTAPGYTSDATLYGSDGAWTSYDPPCTHSYTDTVTEAATCTTDGILTHTCSLCGYSYSEAIEATGHSYSSTVTAPTCTTDGYTTYTCGNCGKTYKDNTVDAYGHSYVDGTCSVCGTVKAYYLFGYINGGNYACEENISDMGSYKFVDGKLTVTFDADSYVAVKTTDNEIWYMTDGYPEDGTTSVTLYDISLGVDADKLMVPGGVEITFTLTENSDGTLTLSYVTADCAHSYTGKVTTEATCTADGVRTYTCSLCGSSYTETIPATGHSYTAVVTAPTCTESGYTTHTCSACGASYTDSVTDPAGHVWVDGTCSSCGIADTSGCAHSYVAEVTDATCESAASTTYTCTLCGHTYTVAADESSTWTSTVPEGAQESKVQSKTQYSYSDYETVTSSATSLNGYTQTGMEWISTGSNTIYYVKSWPSGFNTSNSLYTQYNNTPVTATETDTSKVAVESDEVVGYIYYHWCMGTYLYGPINRATSATKSGNYTTFHAFYSTTAPSDLSQMDPSDNSYVYPNADCCTDSHWYFYVEVYAQTYTTYEAEYTYGRWTEYSTWSDTPVASSDTRKVTTQTVYRYVDTELAEHSYTSVVTAPTCTTGGYTTHTCTVCGDSYTDSETAALGHSYNSGVVSKAATCTTAGVKTYTCSACGDSYTETIPATGHSYRSAVTAPTCTTGGYTTHTCTACGSSYTDSETAALGHSYNSGVVTKAATCTTAGVKTYTCSACGDSYTETIPATGHSYENGVCTNCGEADPDFVTAPTVSLKFPTLSFEDEIFYNVVFAVDNPDGVEITEMGLLTWFSAIDGTVDTAEAVIPGVEAYGSYWMARSQGIAAKEMGETLYFKAYVKLADGSYAYSDLKYYSATTYAMGKLSSASTSDELKALCVALLNYGAAAQTYFGYNAENLMNAGLTAEQQALVEAYSSGMLADVVNADASKTTALTANGGFGRKYPAIDFGGAFSISYNFVPSATVDGEMKLYVWDAETYASVDALTLDNATQVITMTDDGSGTYVGDVSGIAAKDVDSTVYVCGVYESDGTTYYTGVLAYSLGTYCKAQAAGTGTMQPFAAATAVYAYYAKIYLSSI